MPICQKRILTKIQKKEWDEGILKWFSQELFLNGFIYPIKTKCESILYTIITAQRKAIIS